MKRRPLFVFNVALAVLLAGLYARAVVEPSWEAAFRTTWWAGLIVGLSVAVGATVGPRPALGWKKCVSTQVWIVITSALFALAMTLLPKEVVEVERGLEEEIARRGLRASSGIGAIVGTVVQIIQVYVTRRRAARRP
ncbi:MAG TPA: hypothetical protein VF950_01620 [Planctomycetota bacterium]